MCKDLGLGAKHQIFLSLPTLEHISQNNSVNPNQLLFLPNNKPTVYLLCFSILPFTLQSLQSYTIVFLYHQRTCHSATRNTQYLPRHLPHIAHNPDIYPTSTCHPTVPLIPSSTQISVSLFPCYQFLHIPFLSKIFLANLYHLRLDFAQTSSLHPSS